MFMCIWCHSITNNHIMLYKCITMLCLFRSSSLSFCVSAVVCFPSALRIFLAEWFKIQSWKNTQQCLQARKQCSLFFSYSFFLCRKQCSAEGTRKYTVYLQLLRPIAADWLAVDVLYWNKWVIITNERAWTGWHQVVNWCKLGLKVKGMEEHVPITLWRNPSCLGFICAL